jgi:hypothetical protein
MAIAHSLGGALTLQFDSAAKAAFKMSHFQSSLEVQKTTILRQTCVATMNHVGMSDENSPLVGLPVSFRAARARNKFIQMVQC